MGLSFEVGILADLLEHDEEGAARVQAHFADINEHNEPRQCDVWSAEGVGYTGLHALREVAGLSWRGQPIPHDRRLTGWEETRTGDDLFGAALDAVSGEEQPGFLWRLLSRRPAKKPPPFSHLVFHSDAQGYYVPVDFPHPLIPNRIRKDTASIWPLGSVQRLDCELDTLVGLLQIPNGAYAQSEALQRALRDEQVEPSDPLWLVQSIASYSALIMKEACANSLRTGGAIAFC
ncbi:MAG: hypothetical protein AAFU80_07395 [Pseudomonadota bacterium]